VAIGSLSRAWSSTNMEGNYVNICRYYALLWERTRGHFRIEYAKTWIDYIGPVASAYLAAEDEDRKSFKRLIDFGYRRAHSFMSTTSGSMITLDIQLLRLSNLSFFLSSFKNTESKIGYLRKLLQDRHPSTRPDKRLILCPCDQSYCFATALPGNGPGIDGTEKLYHFQWIEKLPIIVNFKNSALAGELTKKVREQRLNKMVHQRGWSVRIESKSARLCLLASSSMDFSEDEIPSRYYRTEVVHEPYALLYFDLAYGLPDIGALYRKSIVADQFPEQTEVSIDDILAAIGDGQISIQKLTSLDTFSPDVEALYPF
jgi:hypothetical protein